MIMIVPFLVLDRTVTQVMIYHVIRGQQRVGMVLGEVMVVLEGAGVAVQVIGYCVVTLVRGRRRPARFSLVGTRSR